MKAQTKQQSLIESASGTVIGLVFSFVIQIIMYPILEIPVSVNQSLLLTSIFTVASVVRSYFVRRLFNKIFR